EEALATAASTGEQWFVAELLRIRAGCHLDRGDAAAAQADLLSAVELARSQGASMWALRAAVDLARLWAADDREAEAAALLRPVYEGFTEGFRTSDVLAARTLLASLEEAAPAAPHL